MKDIKIMLDPGHYASYNPSPVVKGYYESRRMWKLCGYLEAALRRYGFTVLCTREDEERDRALFDRGYSAKGCDLFISLHTDGVGGAAAEKVDRVEVIRAFDNKNDANVLAGKLGEAVAGLMGVSDGYVIWTKRTRDGLREYYGVLRGARAAGCPLYYIIEHSFHTNKRSASWLMKDENLFRLAQAEAAVIASYYGASLKKLVADLDGNGRLDANDLLVLKRAVLGSASLSESQKKQADVNGDGKFDTTDYLLAKRAYLGTYEPPEGK